MKQIVTTFNEIPKILAKWLETSWDVTSGGADSAKTVAIFL